MLGPLLDHLQAKNVRNARQKTRQKLSEPLVIYNFMWYILFYIFYVLYGFLTFFSFFTFFSSFLMFVSQLVYFIFLAASVMFVSQLVYFQNNNNNIRNWFHNLFSTKTKTITKLIIIDGRTKRKNNNMKIAVFGWSVFIYNF